MHHSISLSLVALASSALVATHSARGPLGTQDKQPTLSGTWTLNEQKSEKYDPKRDKELDQGDATGGDLRTGYGSSSGGGRRAGSATGGGSRTSSTSSSGTTATMSPMAMRVMREATTQPHSLRIEQTDSSIAIQGGARPLSVLTNGQESADSTIDGSIAYAVKAMWKKDQLVIERQIGNGATMMRQTYYLDKKDPKTLIVDVRFEDKTTRKTIDNRRVYNMGG